MTINDRIFEQMKVKKLSQKEFSKRTGISESAISDWKKKGTNPASDKILIICEVLEISPTCLLSGTEPGSSKCDHLVISKDSEEGILVENFLQLDREQQARVMGYVDAIRERDN